MLGTHRRRNAVVLVDEKPECNAGGETRAGGEKEWMIDFIKHDDGFSWLICLIFV